MTEIELAGRHVAIVAAHPDDETIGAGGVLPRLRDPVVIHITDGAPRSRADAARYAQVRRDELAAALRMGCAGPYQAIALDWVDQEAAFHLSAIARRLRELLESSRPEAVLTHPYEGGHPDHDAAAFAVRAACALMKEPPRIVEFTSYHSRGGCIETGVFLPAAGSPEIAVELDDSARETKQRMFACYASQREMLRQFAIGTERFRIAPRYDFRAPPYAGRLFYEQFPWGMTADRWIRLAHQALAELKLC